MNFNRNLYIENLLHNQNIFKPLIICIDISTPEISTLPRATPMTSFVILIFPSLEVLASF